MRMKSGKLKGVRTSRVSELPADRTPTRSVPPRFGVPPDGPLDRGGRASAGGIVSAASREECRQWT